MSEMDEVKKAIVELFQEIMAVKMSVTNLQESVEEIQEDKAIWDLENKIDKSKNILILEGMDKDLNELKSNQTSLIIQITDLLNGNPVKFKWGIPEDSKAYFGSVTEWKIL